MCAYRYQQSIDEHCLLKMHVISTTRSTWYSMNKCAHILYMLGIIKSTFSAQVVYEHHEATEITNSDDTAHFLTLHRPPTVVQLSSHNSLSAASWLVVGASVHEYWPPKTTAPPISHPLLRRKTTTYHYTTPTQSLYQWLTSAPSQLPSMKDPIVGGEERSGVGSESG